MKRPASSIPARADAHLRITVYFADRDPLAPMRSPCRPDARSTSDSTNCVIPNRSRMDTDYASVIEFDVPIVVQHTRLDSRQAENALMTTIAFPS
jgi:hypothetical protein